MSVVIATPPQNAGSRHQGSLATGNLLMQPPKAQQRVNAFGIHINELSNIILHILYLVKSFICSAEATDLL